MQMWGTYFGPDIFAWILVAEKGQNKCVLVVIEIAIVIAIAYATRVFFRIPENVWISVVDEFRPYFLTKPPQTYVPPNDCKPHFQKTSNGSPFKNRLNQKERVLNSKGDSILQLCHLAFYSEPFLVLLPNHTVFIVPPFLNLSNRRL